MMLISRFSKSISKLLKTVRFPISSLFGERTVGKNKMTNGRAKCQKEKTTKYSRKFGGFGVPGAARTRGLSLRRSPRGAFLTPYKSPKILDFTGFSGISLLVNSRPKPANFSWFFAFLLAGY